MNWTQLDSPYREKDFIESLNATITCCSKIMTIAEFDTLIPTFMHNYPHLFEPQYQVNHVIEQRQKYLIKDNSLHSVNGLGGGRLMLYCPFMTDSSSAAGDASNGFLDAHGTPPFATWVWYVIEDFPPGSADWREYVVAWVSLQFVKQVDTGLRVDPTECVLWLDKLDTPFVRSLRRLKIIP
jgi:hypothetical protein